MKFWIYLKYVPVEPVPMEFGGSELGKEGDMMNDGLSKEFTDNFNLAGSAVSDDEYDDSDWEYDDSHESSDDSDEKSDDSDEEHENSHGRHDGSDSDIARRRDRLVIRFHILHKFDLCYTTKRGSKYHLMQ